MHLFISHYENRIDRKGRVSIPARFRSVMKARLRNSAISDKLEYSRLVVYPSRSSFQGCPILIACDEIFLNRIVEKASNRPSENEEESMLYGTLARCHELNIDADGRILLPKELIKHADLSDLAFFVGMGDRFQIVGKNIIQYIMQRSQKKIITPA